jgi:tetratricopeptide (TPR) repeat protein
LVQPARAWVAAGLATAVLSVLTALTARQVGYWTDSERLLSHALDATSDNALIHATLGSLLRTGDATRPAAIAHLREALRILPQLQDTRYELALTLKADGRFDEAIQQYDELVRARPNDPRIRKSFGVCLAARGSKDAAIAQFQAAVELDPRDSEAYNNLGKALADGGQTEAAIRAFRTSLQLNSSAALTHFNLANALADAGLEEESNGEYRQAAALAAAQGRADLAGLIRARQGRK